MANNNKKNTKQNTTKAKTETKKATNGNRIIFLIATIFLFTGIALLLSFISYFSTGNYDQSVIDLIGDSNVKSDNWLGKLGAFLANFFIYEGFGIASFLFVKISISISAYFIFKFPASRLRRIIFWDLFAIIILSISLGHFSKNHLYLGGNVGFEMNDYIQSYLGNLGTTLLIIFFILFYLLFRIKMSPERFTNIVKGAKNTLDENIAKAEELIKNNETEVQTTKNVVTPSVKESSNEIVKPTNKSTIVKENEEVKSEIVFSNQNHQLNNDKKTYEGPELSTIHSLDNTNSFDLKTEVAPKQIEIPLESTEEFIIEQVEEELTIEENLANKLVADFGEFDPTLELSKYQFPSSELLIEHTTKGITINQAELEENKNRIVETLNNYKIGIAQIKATVGPTVTLYEIVPDAGIRISKIKSLEDDIALSLAALGIRIIAPIPGKGTIGIEVPNTNPTTVSMRSLISSPKFQNAEMELPIAIGKTISNETFVFDLAKMPHLLMAGATGQGKSVGLNAVLTSLLYKKHPAEVKFVLVDPKKVELTLFNKIERHYLAKLPDTDEAIITDNTKVINTLNSLCIEMDNRYSLLKDAMVRNIKEYNEKFKQRKLNPENGHKFLPYIILVVDEFADLIMTAGKEVETPIARLAQLARAIGIHLIIATQRPSVNVITGIIKANFPARIAFRVSSKIDSRTILDGPGADQLIGRGDLLFTQGNDTIRVQCGFVDTPEVEKITEFIGSQKGYSDAYLLPEYVGEETGTSLDIDIADRDVMFREAAEIIVTAQQGSASLLQRKLKLGYNRAGRIIDQLEAAGIVGPFEGSKARSVNITDLASLDHFLNNENNNN